MSTPPKAPADLRRGGPGRRLWSEVTGQWDLTPTEAATLAEAARGLDELELLRAALVGQPMTVAGSNGQPRPHPLLGELRAHRETVGRLLASLHLPADVAAAAPSMRSANAQKAAVARWDAERAKDARRNAARARGAS